MKPLGDPRSAVVDLRDISISLISSYPPTRCGVGRFSHSLSSAWRRTAPGVEIKVMRVTHGGEAITPRGDIEAVFDPASLVAMRRVARCINDSDVAVLQHEYGLYGPDDGVAVITLADQIEVPLVSVLHTVLAQPTPRQRQIIQHLGRRGTIVVPTDTARRRLEDAHDVDPADIHVIPHGSEWSSSPPFPGERRRLITWGLLGPGKGIERSLRAVARLNLQPPVTYDIVGQTHPNVLARSGQEYRRSLYAIVDDLGLMGRVRFIDRYMDDEGLRGLVSASHLVVIPYDNQDQVCSGVLTEAVAAGRPVAATAFPHAEELLATGAGRVVPHNEADLADAIHLLLTDDDAYDRAARRASELSADLSWDGVAARYLKLLHHRKASIEVA